MRWDAVEQWRSPSHSRPGPTPTLGQAERAGPAGGPDGWVRRGARCGCMCGGRPAARGRAGSATARAHRGRQGVRLAICSQDTPCTSSQQINSTIGTCGSIKTASVQRAALAGAEPLSTSPRTLNSTKNEIGYIEDGAFGQFNLQVRSSPQPRKSTEGGRAAWVPEHLVRQANLTQGAGAQAFGVPQHVNADLSMNRIQLGLHSATFMGLEVLLSGGRLQ